MEEIVGISQETLINNALVWGKQLVVAALILWIGMRVVRIMLKGFKKALQLREIDKAWLPFWSRY